LTLHYVATPKATVPGDLVSDLQNAGIAPDPLTDTNFKNTTFWNGKRWTYRKQFEWPNAAEKGTGVVRAGEDEVLLVLEGVKMGAAISLNGELLGNITDQFLRTSYPVAALLKPTNTLEVVFDQSIYTHGRFMHGARV
jgi:hypothetical protein